MVTLVPGGGFHKLGYPNSCSIAGWFIDVYLLENPSITGWYRGTPHFRKPPNVEPCVFKVEQRTPKCFKLKVFEAKVNFDLPGLPRPRVASPLSVSHAPGISLSWCYTNNKAMVLGSSSSHVIPVLIFLQAFSLQPLFLFPGDVNIWAQDWKLPTKPLITVRSPTNPLYSYSCVML